MAFAQIHPDDHIGTVEELDEQKIEFPIPKQILTPENRGAKLYGK